MLDKLLKRQSDILDRLEDLESYEPDEATDKERKVLIAELNFIEVQINTELF